MAADLHNSMSAAALNASAAGMPVLKKRFWQVFMLDSTVVLMYVTEMPGRFGYGHQYKETLRIIHSGGTCAEPELLVDRVCESYGQRGGPGGGDGPPCCR